MKSSNKPKIGALITARGNNALKHKHLLLVLGKPLVEYPINAVKNCPMIDHIYISSDDKNILQLGSRKGCRAIERPSELSLPTSLHADAIFHALKVMKDEDSYRPDFLVVVLGNTVYFKSEWIKDSIKMLLKNNKISAVVPVYMQNDHHPYRAKYIDKNGFLQPYFDFSKKKISTNRQDLSKNYFLCHNFWTLRVSELLLCRDGQPPWTFMGKNIRPLIVKGGPDVHSKSDIKLSEICLKNNKI